MYVYIGLSVKNLDGGYSRKIDINTVILTYFRSPGDPALTLKETGIKKNKISNNISNKRIKLRFFLIFSLRRSLRLRS